MKLSMNNKRELLLTFTQLLCRWQPAVFSNIPQTVKGSEPADNDLPVIQAALRTSAAPTLFPLHQGYADGLYAAGVEFAKSRHS